MKLKLTLSSLLLTGAALSANAQPTLTAATSVPTAGLSTVYNQNETFLAGSAGTNQSWDFSGQTFSNVSTITYESCNSTNNCSSFPGTTIVGNQNGSYVYYAANASAYSLNGVASGGQNIPYSNAQDLYRFPCSYGNTYTDSWATTISSSGVVFYRTGIDSVTADAWGTLITPAGTFNNTLRVKRISTYQDSANIQGTTFLITYKQTLYTWNDATHQDVLYSTYTLESNTLGNIQTDNSSTYTTQSGGTTTAIHSIANASFNWSVSPNPATDNITLSFDLKDKTEIEVMITDLSGRVIQQVPNGKTYEAGIQKLNVQLNQLPKGLYFVKAIIDGNSLTKKLIVQ